MSYEKNVITGCSLENTKTEATKRQCVPKNLRKVKPREKAGTFNKNNSGKSKS